MGGGGGILGADCCGGSGGEFGGGGGGITRGVVKLTSSDLGLFLPSAVYACAEQL